MAVALFVSAGVLALSSCSGSDDDEAVETPAAATVDYAALLTSQEWEVTEKAEALGTFWLSVKNPGIFCRLTADSIFFTTSREVSYIDENGKVSEPVVVYDPRGSYPYAVKGEEIKIADQAFTISLQDSTLVLYNQEWRLKIKKKK